jgi:hypothetical protein
MVIKLKNIWNNLDGWFKNLFKSSDELVLDDVAKIREYLTPKDIVGFYIDGIFLYVQPKAVFLNTLKLKHYTKDSLCIGSLFVSKTTGTCIYGSSGLRFNVDKVFEYSVLSTNTITVFKVGDELDDLYLLVNSLGNTMLYGEHVTIRNYLDGQLKLIDYQ